MKPRQQTVIEIRGSSTFFFKSQSLYRGRAQQEEAQNFSKSQGPYNGVEFGIFPKSQRLYEGGAQNFAKSQGPYRYGSAKSNISIYFLIFFTYSFIFFLLITFLHNYIYIFSTYFFIFSTSLFIFLVYSFLFCHIPSYF